MCRATPQTPLLPPPPAPPPPHPPAHTHTIIPRLSAVFMLNYTAAALETAKREADTQKIDDYLQISMTNVPSIRALLYL